MTAGLDVSKPILSLDAEEYLSWLTVERGRARNTLVAYRRDLLAYEEFLLGRHVSVAEVDESIIEDYIKFLKATRKRPTSIARALVVVRGLHQFCLDEKRASTDPTESTRTPKIPQSLPKALSEFDIEMLLNSCAGAEPKDLRNRAILEVLYGTGMRISELVALSMTDLMLDEGMIRAFGKGSKERIVPVGRLAREALTIWLSPAGRGAMEPARWSRAGDAEAVFLNARGGRLGRQGMWAIVKHYGDLVGLGDRLTPHVLRHSCATHMLDHGADVRVVQELLGHASIATTQIYTKVSLEHLRSAYAKAHPRARR